MKVLGLFPGRMAGQCALMSAAYSIALEKLGTQPGYVVAGSLYIGDKRIFGDDKEFDGKVLFSKSNPDWNGHAWIVYGDYLADVSVFRTADAGSPRLLSKHVAKEYGRGRGILFLSLKPTYIGTINARVEGELLLRQPAVHPDSTQIPCDQSPPTHPCCGRCAGYNHWSAWRVERLSHRQQDAGARSASQYGNHSCFGASLVFTRGGHNHHR